MACVCERERKERKRKMFVKTFRCYCLMVLETNTFFKYMGRREFMYFFIYKTVWSVIKLYFIKRAMQAL